MTKTYDEHEVEQLAKAKKQAAEYEAARRAQADRAVATSNALYDTAIDTTKKNYTASAKETESGYRSLYDANVVSELVARKQAEEAIRNMNLANSGLSNTEQTAISLQRGRADTETTRQKQAAVDAIMRELDSVRAQYEAEKTAAGRDIQAQAETDILSFRTNADAAARQNAAALYAADAQANGVQQSADLQSQKLAAMNATYAPSYTAIDTQAALYARTDKNTASDYIERQYTAGYITEAQKNALDQKYGVVGFTGSTYSEAYAFALSQGVSDVAAAGMMTAAEWRARKQRGGTGPEVTLYNSYADYLRAYVQYLVDNPSPSNVGRSARGDKSF